MLFDQTTEGPAGVTGRKLEVVRVVDCNKLHFVPHARVGRFGPFCIRGVWPLLCLWSVAMALASF